MEIDESFPFLDYNRVVSITKDLIRLNSDSMEGKEYAIGEYIYNFFKKLGVKTEKQFCAPDRFNVIVSIEGKSKYNMLYCGHMDNVPEGEINLWSKNPYDPVVEDSKVFGRGACDMKGSLACSMCAAEYLIRTNQVFYHSLTLLYDIDEENKNLGLRTYLKHPGAFKLALIGEPTELNIAVGHKGVMAFRVTLTGKSVHAAQAAWGKNAVYAADVLIQEIQKLQEVLNRKNGTLLGTASITVTQIQGGKKVNMVPETCTVGIDRRLTDGDTREKCEKELEDILNTVKEKTGCGYLLETTTYCPPGLCNKEEAKVKWISKIIREVNPEAGTGLFEASCEAGVIQEAMGIPAVIIGPGSIRQAHNADEYIELSQLETGLTVYTAVFYDWLMEGKGEETDV